MVLRYHTILELACRTPIPPEYHMFPSLEGLQEMSEMSLICHFDRSSELVPGLCAQCWFLLSELTMKISGNCSFVYTVSSFLVLTACIESDEFLIGISPCSTFLIHRLVVMGECPYDLILRAWISECGEYSSHRCYLT